MNNWHIEPIPADEIQGYAKKYGIPALAAQAFLRRGLTRPEDVRYYLDHNIRSAHVPFLFSDMENVIERLDQAKDDQEKILVFGDRDVDGMTSTTLMVQRLRSLGLDVAWRVPMEDQNYGLTLQVVEEASREGISLIITVDCGITSLDEIDRAAEAGIDVIVIDHHNPLDELPAAVGIIDPKTEDAGYPFDGLCAAGLVAKVLFAWDLSRSAWYGQEFCLVNIRPGNDSLFFEALHVKNLVETARLSENIVEQSNAQVFNRILPFIQGYPLVVYDKPQQLKYLQRLFGASSDIYLDGLEDRVGKSFPELKGRSLFRMLGGSRLARFSSTAPGELDVLKHLFQVLCLADAPEAIRRHEEGLGIVALGTVADMAPLRDENRILLARGLETLVRVRNPGLTALMRELQILQEPISLKDIGWKLTPVLNSSGRLGRPDVAMNLLLSEDAGQIQSLVKELVQLNDTRKRQGDMAWLRIRSMADESLLRFKNKLVFVRDDEAGRGITGILAARLSREYSVPALVLTSVEDRCVGSIRTARGVKATELLARFADLLTDWGGHDAAGGFSLGKDDVDGFQSRLLDLAGELELSAEEAGEQAPDVLVDPALMTEELWKVEEIFQPYGLDSPQLLYLCRNVQITEIQLVGKEKQHVKLSIQAGQRIWPAIYWNAVDKIPAVFKNQDRVDIAFRLEKNTWGPNTLLQLNVLDLRRSQPT